MLRAKQFTIKHRDISVIPPAFQSVLIKAVKSLYLGAIIIAVVITLKAIHIRL